VRPVSIMPLFDNSGSLLHTLNTFYIMMLQLKKGWLQSEIHFLTLEKTSAENKKLLAKMKLSEITGLPYQISRLNPATEATRIAILQESVQLETAEHDKAIQDIESIQQDIEKVEYIFSSFITLENSIAKFLQCHDQANTMKLNNDAQQIVESIKININSIINNTRKRRVHDQLNYFIDDTQSLIRSLTKLEEIHQLGYAKPNNISERIRFIFANYTINKINMDSTVTQHRIHKLRQGEIPIIAIDEGFCEGIGMEITKELLTKDDDHNLSLIQVLNNGTNLTQIAFSQQQVIMNFKQGDNDTLLRKLGAIDTNDLHTFADGHTIGYSSWGAAKHIATEICSILKNIHIDENYALNLGLNSCDLQDGHSIALVHKNNSFYLIDANSGVYKFGTLAELQDFSSLYLYEFRYSQIFSNYSIINYPNIEKDFPLPDSIKDKIKATGILEETPEPNYIKALSLDCLFMFNAAACITKDAAITYVKQRLKF